jgi:hypothetical protein
VDLDRGHHVIHLGRAHRPGALDQLRRMRPERHQAPAVNALVGAERGNGSREFGDAELAGEEDRPAGFDAARVL